ncbi:MAG: hypothetical protein VX392_02265 [Verrucomicrobiota bacterium]|nr:hypothetical protein [Verrucomicrobiota bacterium]
MSTGEMLPCSAEAITEELLGDDIDLIDPQVIQEVLKAVVHYFREDQAYSSVSVDQFSNALGKVLQCFGFDIVFDEEPVMNLRIEQTDLCKLANETLGQGFELFFFQQLRKRVLANLHRSPNIIQFNGLRDCVKQLVGAERWCGRCRRMHRQIVTYLRTCLDHDSRRDCSLLIR